MSVMTHVRVWVVVEIWQLAAAAAAGEDSNTACSRAQTPAHVSLVCVCVPDATKAFVGAFLKAIRETG